jgi:NAD(P)-dependent dehydrogenase (short-subunit alcohol dehydrogenase family)
MSQGKTDSIAVIGHTRGIGKAIVDLYKGKGFEVLGMSRSNGYDMTTEQEKIVDAVKNCVLVVINAYAGRSQLNLLKDMYGRYHNDKKKIAVITSTSGTPEGMDEDFTDVDYQQYCEDKKELIGYIRELQEDLLPRAMSVYDVCPDVVDTEMTKGLWTTLPKLAPEEVAQAVSYCFESTFNINRIVIQKNAG